MQFLPTPLTDIASSALAGEADQTIDPRPGNSDSVYGSWEKNGPTCE